VNQLNSYQTTNNKDNFQDSEIPRTSYKATLKSIFGFGGKSLAVTLNFKEWELSESENEMLAIQGDDCLGEFFPQIQSKYGKLIAFIFTIISVFGTKWFKYETYNNSQKKKEKQTKKEPEIKNQNGVIIRDGV